jgi:acyl-CoA synthetase (AMP-forming)/AMP-acid ligase II
MTGSVGFVPERLARDPVVAGLLGPGGPFELKPVDYPGGSGLIFASTPPTLSHVYAAAGAFADRDFIVDGARRLTYAQTFAQAAALADTLVRRYGVGPGRRVALVMRNCPEWMIAFIAVTAAGGSAALVNSRGTAAEIRAALDRAEVSLVIADPQRMELLEGDPRPGIVVGDATPRRGWTGWADALAGGAATALPQLALTPEDEAVVMFTSGTTAQPKGAMLTHRGMTMGLMNIQYAMAMIGARMAAKYGPEVLKAMAARPPSSLLSFPLVHVSGCVATFLSILGRGGKLVMLPKWNAEHAIDLIEAERIGQMSGAPTMMWDLLRSDRAGRDLSSLVSVGVGGQALPTTLLDEMVGAFPNALPGAGYGSTETIGAICSIVGDELRRRPTASGQLVPVLQMRLVDDDGRDVPEGGVGEVWLKGPMLMRGYCGDAEATAQAMQDGWLKMGDLARVDEDGYLHIVDRKKNIVISGGENISCAEVERAAASHPDVQETVCFGVPDDRLGERLLMAAVPHPGRRIDTEALHAHIAGQLAIYKTPRQIFPVSGLPRNALEKVDRNELKRRALAGEL